MLFALSPFTLDHISTSCGVLSPQSCSCVLRSMSERSGYRTGLAHTESAQGQKK